MFIFIIFWVIILFLVITSIYFYLYQRKLLQKESSIIKGFLERTDNMIGIYEITKWYLEKHTEIFESILDLRKKEFHLKEVSENIEAFYELELLIHHELNFIFQVCNTHPKLQKDKKFLYLRDIILEKSFLLWKKIDNYNKHIEVYNTMIVYKNYSLIGFMLPFHKKILLR